MLKSMYPFFSAIVALIIAQAVKPFCYYLVSHKWEWNRLHDSGGFPSSHSSMVSALTLSVGLQERFSSTIFAVTMTFAIIVIYDAANVRYYSGQNAKVTQQLVKDLKEEHPFWFSNPIYSIKLKNVLGHKWREVLAGIVLGCLIALAFHYWL